MSPHELHTIPAPSPKPSRRLRPVQPPERPPSPRHASDRRLHRPDQPRDPIPSTPASSQCCGRLRAQRSQQLWLLRIGSSIRCAAFLPVSSARNSGSTLFQNKPTRVGSIASRMAKLRLPLRTGPNRRPDAMQKKRRNGRASTKMSVEDEIAHLRGLDLKGLRSHWHSVFQRQAPAHLTRHLLFAVIAYRIQADRLGDLDHKTRQVLDRTVSKGTGPAMSARLASFDQKRTELSPGTVLVREWDRQSQRVMVMADGFAWNGQTYDSLSKVAFAITGTRWNGPRFFGLRDKEDRSAMEARP